MDSDALLLNRYAEGGDATAFTEIAHRYKGMVYAVARRITDSHHDAEDVAQNCFLELAYKASTIRESVAGWLHRQATHRAIDARRQISARERHESRALAPEAQEAGPTWDAVGPIIDQAIEQLPRDQRLAVILYFLQGLTQDEVAESLGISRRTAVRRIDEGIANIRHYVNTRGVTATSASLVVLMQAFAQTACPSTLTVMLTKIGLAGIGVTQVGPSKASLVLGKLTALTLPAGAQTLLLFLVLALLTGAAGYLAHESLQPHEGVTYSLLAEAYAPYLDADDQFGFSLKSTILSADQRTLWHGGQDIFYAWLAEHHADWFAATDRVVQSVGDVRLGNVGAFTKRLDSSGPPTVEVGFHDFDRACQLPIEVELLQGSISLMLVLRQPYAQIKPAQHRLVLDRFFRCYRDGLLGDAPADRREHNVLLQSLTRQVDAGAYPRAQVSKYVLPEGGFRRLILDDTGRVSDLLRPTDLSPQELAAGLAQAASLSPQFAAVVGHGDAASFQTRILDAAEWVNLEAASNAGLRKYLVLVQPSQPAEAPHLVYFKEQIPVSAARLGLIPSDHQTAGRRVAEGSLTYAPFAPVPVSHWQHAGRSYSAHLRDAGVEPINAAGLVRLDRTLEAAEMLGYCAGGAHQHESHATYLAATIDAQLQQHILAAAEDFLAHLDDAYADLIRDPRLRRDRLALDHAIQACLAEADHP